MNKYSPVDQEIKKLVSLIGSNISRRRKELGMTQERLAELADINEKYLSSIENGREANLSIGYLVRISSAMDISFLELIPEGR